MLGIRAEMDAFRATVAVALDALKADIASAQSYACKIRLELVEGGNLEMARHWMDNNLLPSLAGSSDNTS